MPQVNLTDLSTPELRGLLDSTRQRGQAAQSYEILQEMAARRAAAEGGKTPKRAPRGSGPRLVSVDLGDPMDHPDELIDTVVEPPPPAEPLDDIGMDLAQAVQDRTPRRKPPRARRERPPVAGPRAQPRKRWQGIGFAAGIAIGVILGCGVAIESLSKPATSPVAVFPEAPMLRPDQVPPPPAPRPAEVAVVPEAAPVVAEAAPPAAAEVAEAAVPAAAAQPDLVAPDEDKVGELAAAAETPKPADERCDHAGTPADRTICTEPRLKDLQQRLRDAYAEALDAHADRALLRQHQLAWRDARNDVSDPQQLAKLYEARIRKLNAATEEARKAR